MNKDEQIQEYHNYADWICAWIKFGASIFALHDVGLTHADLSKDNVRYVRDKNSCEVVFIDFGGMPKIAPVKDCHKISTSLMSLLRWVSDDELSAFRFGYLHYGGPLAEWIFNDIRNLRGLNGFRNCERVQYTSLGLNNYVDDEEYDKWIKFRKSMNYGNLLKTSLQVQHLYQWRTQRNTINFSNEAEVGKANEYHYLKHIACSFYERNFKELIIALLNLKGYYFNSHSYNKGLGLSLYCKFLINRTKIEIPQEHFETIERDIMLVSPEVNPAEINTLERMFSDSNIFHIMWCLDDLEMGEVSLIKNI